MSRAWCWVALVVLATLGGCKCDDRIVPVDQGDGGDITCAAGAASCSTNDDCGERSVCKQDHKTGFKCCEETFRACTDDSGCCPGQVCTTDGRCVDKFDECEVASDCGETPDRVCQQWNDPLLGASMRCTWARCGANDACPDGQACFDHFCVINPPCNGACPSGTACVPQAGGGGRCHPFGQRCDLTPKPGYLVVFTDPDNVFDVCLMSKIACEYAELPPLAAVDLGRHPSAAVVGGSIVVAQYDGFYGDLVVGDYDATGHNIQLTWVDGVPSSGTVTGGPSGPRHGIADPGDDVGKYTSIAAKPDGTLYVSYYDQTHGDLRFAERSSDGKTWTTHLVDGLVADVGLYTSLALDADGKPAIAYFQRAGSDDPSVSCPSDPGAAQVLITGLKLARATTEHPRSAADWTVKMVSCAARPPPPCFGCGTGGANVCIVDATSKNGTACKASSSGCAPSCANGQVCIAGNTCAGKASATELLDVPWGKGLFPSLAFKGGNPYIAYYDHNRGNLDAALPNGAAFTEVVIDGEDAQGDTGNVGMFPSLLVDATGNFQLAYHDFTRRGLRLYSGPTLAALSQQRSPPASSFIDDGISDPKGDGPAWVGANASLALMPSGLWLAYQNSTSADLRLTHRDASSNTWKIAQQWTSGALGFFAHAVPMGDSLVIVHTKIHAKTAGGKPVPDNALQIEIYKPTP